MSGGKNCVKIVPQPRTPRGKSVVDEDLVGLTYGISAQELDEIMMGLRRLNDGSKSIRERVDSIDDQVRRTQMDLESLVSRSSNNNKHLQSLLLSSNDIKELHELLEKLTKVQELQLTRNNEVEEIVRKVVMETIMNERVESLQEELGRWKGKSQRIDDLDEAIIKKEKRLQELETSIGFLEEKYRERHNKYTELRQRAKELQSSVVDQSLARYKSVQDTLAVSLANLNLSAKEEESSSARVISLLRNKYMDTNSIGTRRVVSMNEMSHTKSYRLSAPNNNSDVEEEL